MPTYTYKCTKCNIEKDYWHAINDPKPVCESCNEDTLKQIISPTNFILQGEGWYKTDYNRVERAKKLNSE